MKMFVNVKEKTSSVIVMNDSETGLAVDWSGGHYCLDRHALGSSLWGVEVHWNSESTP